MFKHDVWRRRERGDISSAVSLMASFIENDKRVCSSCNKAFALNDTTSFQSHRCDNGPISGKRTRQVDDDDQPHSKRSLSDCLSSPPASLIQSSAPSYPREPPASTSAKLLSDDPETLNKYLQAVPSDQAALARLGYRSLADIIIGARSYARLNPAMPKDAIHPCALLAWLHNTKLEAGLSGRICILFEDAVADGVLRGENAPPSGGRERYKWIGLHLSDAERLTRSLNTITLPAAAPSASTLSSPVAVPYPREPSIHPREPYAHPREPSPHKPLASPAKLVYPREGPARDPFTGQLSAPSHGLLLAPVVRRPHHATQPPLEEAPDHVPSPSELSTLALNSEDRLVKGLQKLHRTGRQDVKLPISALNELCQRTFAGCYAVFTEDQFATIRQWSVKLPAAAGAPTISARGGTSTETIYLKNVCALKAIVRLCPSSVHTWGDFLVHLEQVKPRKTTPLPSEQPHRLDDSAVDAPNASPEVIDLISSDDEEEQHTPPHAPSVTASDKAVAMASTATGVGAGAAAAAACRAGTEEAAAAAAMAMAAATAPAMVPAGVGDELLAEVATACVRQAGGTVSLCAIVDAWRRHRRSDEIEKTLMSSHRGSSRLIAAQQWLEGSSRFVIRGQSFMATVALAGDARLPAVVTPVHAASASSGSASTLVGAAAAADTLDTLVDPIAKARLQEWVTAKRARDFSTADRLRAELMAIGIKPDQICPRPFDSDSAGDARLSAVVTPVHAASASSGSASTLVGAAGGHRTFDLNGAKHVPPPTDPPLPPDPPPLALPTKVHERCRFLRITNLPSDYSEAMAYALVKVAAHVPPMCTVENCQMELSVDGFRWVALIEMKCTREATTMKSRLIERPLHGIVLEVSYDLARVPVLAGATTADSESPSASSSQPPRPSLSLEVELPPHASPMKTLAQAYATAMPAQPSEICRYSYVIGHADAARDIEANATVQVETLRRQLEDERQAELARLSAEYACQFAAGAGPPQRAGVSHASAQMDAGSSSGASTGAVREERLVRRQLALRQYVEMRRAMLGSKATAKPWRLTVRRHALLEDVLPAFDAVSAKKRATLFCTTAVKFLNEWGEPEDGQDNGGLTAEMFALFWSSVLAPESGLFSGEHLLLPSVTAPRAQLEAVGMVLCKCVLDDHPIGFGCAQFLFAWLVHGEDVEALHDVHAALRALDDVDPRLSTSWRQLLALPPSQVDTMGLTLENFVTGEGDAPLTAANLEAAVLSGCRQRLFDERRDAMCALRHGFVRCEDLTVQLAAFELDELTSMLQGQMRLSADELLACFAFPSSSEEEARDAGFDDIGSRAAADFEELLRDGSYLDDAARLTLLNWCTALTVLPFGGLRDHKIRLRLYGQEADDSTLPETHTCTREVCGTQAPEMRCTGMRALTTRFDSRLDSSICQTTQTQVCYARSSFLLSSTQPTAFKRLDLVDRTTQTILLRKSTPIQN